MSRLQSAISKLKRERPHIRVELEADTVEQVRRFLTLDGVEVILLDNMTLAQLREAVSLRRPGVVFEASGGVNLQTVRQIAETGVDFISVGELTHSARAVDLSLEISLRETQGRWACKPRKHDNSLMFRILAIIVFLVFSLGGLRAQEAEVAPEMDPESPYDNVQVLLERCSSFARTMSMTERFPIAT